MLLYLELYWLKVGVEKLRYLLSVIVDCIFWSLFEEYGGSWVYLGWTICLLTPEPLIDLLLLISVLQSAYSFCIGLLPTIFRFVTLVMSESTHSVFVRCTFSTIASGDSYLERTYFGNCMWVVQSRCHPSLWGEVLLLFKVLPAVIKGVGLMCFLNLACSRIGCSFLMVSISIATLFYYLGKDMLFIPWRAE